MTTVLAILVLAAGCSLGLGCQSRAKVTVLNKHAEPVERVRLFWEGDDVTVRRIGAATTWKTSIQPSQDNGMAISYRRSGRDYTCFSYAMFENSWRGTIWLELVSSSGEDAVSFTWIASSGRRSKDAVTCYEPVKP